MKISDSCWDNTTKELVTLAREIEDENTRQEFFDVATRLHVLFHVVANYRDTGKLIKPYEVKCECPDPTES